MTIKELNNIKSNYYYCILIQWTPFINLKVQAAVGPKFINRSGNVFWQLKYFISFIHSIQWHAHYFTSSCRLSTSSVCGQSLTVLSCWWVSFGIIRKINTVSIKSYLKHRTFHKTLSYRTLSRINRSWIIFAAPRNPLCYDVLLREYYCISC